MHVYPYIHILLAHVICMCKEPYDESTRIGTLKNIILTLKTSESDVYRRQILDVRF